MACIIDVKCDRCDEIFSFDKGSILSDTPKDIECPKCKKCDKTHRCYNVPPISICEGHLGNYKTGYTDSITYHKNSLAPSVKGTKIKSIK